MNTTGRTSLNVRQRLAALMMAPALLTAVAVNGIEAWRLIRPEAPLFAAPAPAGFAEAILRDDVLQAYSFVRAGLNPSASIAVRHQTLTADREIEVTPLLWAIAIRADRVVLMLLSHGGALDAARTQQALCLAASLGLDEVASVIARHATEQASAFEGCARQPEGSAVLLNPMFSDR